MAKITLNVQQKPNVPPTVNAGADQAIGLPATSVALNAIATDTDGYIVSTQWSKVSGGNCVITSPITLATNITGMQPGTYIFQVVVFDNFGDSATDTVTVVVSGYQVYPFIWVGGTTQCEESQTGGYTGNLKYLTLKKVSSDENLYPLDANNQRIFYTNLPQDTKFNTVGDPDYKQPFEDLTACPRNRAYSEMPSAKTISGTWTRPTNKVNCDGGDNGIGIRGGSLDNSAMVENTLPGTLLKSFGNSSGLMCNVPATGNYLVKVKATGNAHSEFVNSSVLWSAPLNFYARIGGTLYNLSPMRGPWSEWHCQSQYLLSDSFGAGTGDGPDQPFSFDFNLSGVALTAGDIIDIYFELRLANPTTNSNTRNGGYSITLNTCIIEIKQL